MSDNKMQGMNFFTSNHNKRLIKDEASRTNMPMTRIIASLVDKALQLKNPFEFDLTLPETDDNVADTYAEEGGKFMDYIKTLRLGMGLDMLVLLRHDIGIPDKSVLLYVFADCLRLGLIEGFAPRTYKDRAPFPEGYMYYRIAGHKTGRSRKMKSKKYDQYLKLKKEFEAEG